MNVIYTFAVQLITPTNIPKTTADNTNISKILTFVFVTIGAIAVLMLIIGAIRYIFARSNPERITAAKNVMVYSLIGLIIAASATAIVNFVIGQL